ncbi:cupin domain-containing protein [Nocardiopsis sp. NPDC055551]|uniref:cupin domain-containing protein n=1 Tax=Nocardiopsis sp. NPDC006832 TaxID=3157188 RepID=UPI0033E4E060
MTTENDILAGEQTTFSERAAQAGVVGRWSRANEVLPWRPEPRSRTQKWSYSDLRELAVEVSQEVKEDSGALRVLTMLNPGHPESEAAAGHLYAGLQLLLPNEDMHSHHHAATAVRFVHQSDGGWTAVDGNKIYVEPKDVVVTPSMLWHEHGNDGDCHVIWQDCTDDPLVTAMAASYFDLHPSRSHLGAKTGPADVPPTEHRSASFGGSGPVLRPGGGHVGPQELHYSWRSTKEALKAARPRRDGTAAVTLADTRGGSMTPTIGARFVHIPAHGVSQTSRQTGARIMIAAEGVTEVRIDDSVHVLRQGDTLAVPSWSWAQMRNTGDQEGIVFEYDESPMLGALGLYREEGQDGT